MSIEDFHDGLKGQIWPTGSKYSFKIVDDSENNIPCKYLRLEDSIPSVKALKFISLNKNSWHKEIPSCWGALLQKSIDCSQKWTPDMQDQWLLMIKDIFQEGGGVQQAWENTCHTKDVPTVYLFQC